MVLRGSEMEAKKFQKLQVLCWKCFISLIKKTSFIFNSNSGYFYLRILRLTKDQFIPSASVLL